MISTTCLTANRTTSQLTDKILITVFLICESIDPLEPFDIPAAKWSTLFSLLRESNVVASLHLLFRLGEKLQIDSYRWTPRSFLQMGTVDS